MTDCFAIGFKTLQSRCT